VSFAKEIHRDSISECPYDTYAIGFQLVYHECHRNCDNTAVNQIILICEGHSFVQSSRDLDGSELLKNKPAVICDSNARLHGFRIRYDSDTTDSAGITDVEMVCTNGVILRGGGIDSDEFGAWRNVSYCDPDKWIVGIEEQSDNQKADKKGLDSIRVICKKYSSK
jgi:hypothetical protein